MNIQNNVTDLLKQLEQELMHHNLWSTLPPDQLNSSVPFAADIMPFESWLQFIFIPKMDALIQQGRPLPNNMQITPMAEVTYGDKFISVNNTLKQIDSLSSR